MEKSNILQQLLKLASGIKKIIGKSEYVIQEKSQGNYVTSIDIEIERFLMESLHAIFPEAGIISEESEENVKTWNWVIDPIDGTGNFIHGFPYTISIALINEKREAEIGVVFSPLTEECYYAINGMGAFRCEGETKEKIQVKTFARKEGVIIFGVPYAREKTHKILSIVEKLYDEASDLKRIGPASLDICRVAEGKAKMYVELDLKLWDYAAGALILKEAGGFIEQVGDLSVFSSSPYAK